MERVGPGRDRRAVAVHAEYGRGSGKAAFARDACTRPRTRPSRETPERKVGRGMSSRQSAVPRQSLAIEISPEHLVRRQILPGGLTLEAVLPPVTTAPQGHLRDEVLELVGGLALAQTTLAELGRRLRNVSPAESELGCVVGRSTEPRGN